MNVTAKKESAELRHLNVIMSTDEGFICAVAIADTMPGNGFDDISSEYSRGTFKRAIALLRMTQRAHPEFDAIYEKAILHIRREWLHREAATA